MTTVQLVGIGLFILLALAAYLKRISYTVPPTYKEVILDKAIYDMRQKLEDMQVDNGHMNAKNQKQEFVEVCYTLHMITWGPDAISRKNMSSRIKSLGYKKAITKRPIYHGRRHGKVNH